MPYIAAINFVTAATAAKTIKINGPKDKLNSHYAAAAIFAAPASPNNATTSLFDANVCNLVQIVVYISNPIRCKLVALLISCTLLLSSSAVMPLMTSAVNPLLAIYAAWSAAIPYSVNVLYVAFSAFENPKVVYIACSAAVVSLVALAKFTCASANSFAIYSAFLSGVG